MRDRRVAVVTGAASGIGAATARLLGSRGISVALVGRRRANLDEVALGIEQSGGAAVAVVADLAQQQSPGQIVEEVLAAFGRIDVLVNNAGAISSNAFENVAGDEFDHLVAVNVRAPFFLTQACVQALSRSTHPAVVNISSSAASLALPGIAVYGMTKAALEHLTRSLAIELSPLRIRVNAIAPGPVDTPIHSQWVDDVDAAYDELRRRVPLARMGTSEEVAWWVGHLVDRRCAWVTGAVVAVDGGQVAAAAVPHASVALLR